MIKFKSISLHEVIGRGRVYLVIWPYALNQDEVMGKVVQIDNIIGEVRGIESKSVGFVPREKITVGLLLKTNTVRLADDCIVSVNPPILPGQKQAMEAHKKEAKPLMNWEDK